MAGEADAPSTLSNNVTTTVSVLNAAILRYLPIASRPVATDISIPRVVKRGVMRYRNLFSYSGRIMKKLNHKVNHDRFGGRWGQVFGDDVVAAAMIDRLGRIPGIVATPEVFGSCDGWGSAGFGAADGKA